MRDYQLYHSMKGWKAANTKLDKAVQKAYKDFRNIPRYKPALEEVKRVLTKHVKPVMTALDEFGAHDTEPEWAVVHEFLDLMKADGDFPLPSWDVWDIRNSL